MDGTLPNRKVQQKRKMLQAENYVIVDTIMFRLDINEEKNEVRTRVCVPYSMVPLIFNIYHSSIV